MKKMKKFLVIGGIAVGFSAGLYLISYFMQSKKKKSGIKKLKRTKVVDILNDMKLNFSKVFNACVNMGQQLRQENPCSDHLDLRKCLLSDELPILKELENFEKEIYKKFKVTQPQFENACKVTFKEDQDIQNLMTEMKQSFENSLKGIPPQNTSNCPQHQHQL